MPVSNNNWLVQCSENVFDRDIGPEAIEQWLSQFDESDRTIACTLLENFQYLSHPRFSEQLKNLHNLLTSEADFHQTLFVSVGHPGKSGNLVSYFYRKANHLDPKNFISIDELRIFARLPPATLVLLDDFSGSGRQADRLWSSIKSIIPVNDTKVIYATLVSLGRGRKHIEATTGMKVVSPIEIPSGRLPLSEHSTLFGSDEQRAHAVNTIRKYGARLNPSHPLGYSESGALVGFFYSTPNNTLPVFWTKSRNWHPLLPHSEPLRDSLSLVGSHPAWNSITADGIPDDQETAELAALLLAEFQSLRAVHTLIPTLQRLDIANVRSLLSAIRQVSNQRDEGKPISVSWILTSHPDRIPTNLCAPQLSLSETAKTISFARNVSGRDGALVVRNTGNVDGIHLFADADRPSSAPTRLQKCIHASRTYEALVINAEGDGRADICLRGVQLISMRSGRWYSLGDNVRSALAILAGAHSLSSEAMLEIARIAMELSDQHQGGAFICMGDANSIAQIIDPAGEGTKLNNIELGQTPDNILLTLMRRDGATIIDNYGQVIRAGATLRPPVGIQHEALPGRGTKHQTAAKCSALSKSMCIAISQDGPITFFSSGRAVLRIF